MGKRFGLETIKKHGRRPLTINRHDIIYDIDSGRSRAVNTAGTRFSNDSYVSGALHHHRVNTTSLIQLVIQAPRDMARPFRRPSLLHLPIVAH